MPRRVSNIGRNIRRNHQMRTRRSNETPAEHRERVERVRLQISQSRVNELRSESNRLEKIQARRSISNTNRLTFNKLAFRYDHTIDYSLNSIVTIGGMNNICIYCKALKFKNETQGLCCANGKVNLPVLSVPPEPLLTLISGTTPQSKHFLSNIQKYNNSFQMTSFGATNIITDNFMPTFKVQGQIYHSAGSLLPLPEDTHKFLQIYFIGNSDCELNVRCKINSGTRREIIESLQNLFHQHNELIKLFKTSIEKMPSDNHKIVIRADKTPAGEHSGRFNAPTINEVAIVICGDQFESRDIILHRRNDRLQRVCETHRSYDALQYPLIFWQGQDGYHIQIKMIDPVNGKQIFIKFFIKQKDSILLK